MNRDEMVEAILRSAGLTKANVNRFYRGLVALVKARLISDGEFVLPGLGSLVVRVRKAREGRNPKTGEAIRIPRRKVVRFRAYRDLKQLLNPDLARTEPTAAAPPEPDEPEPPSPTEP